MSVSGGRFLAAVVCFVAVVVFLSFSIVAWLRWRDRKLRALEAEEGP